MGSYYKCGCGIVEPSIVAHFETTIQYGSFIIRYFDSPDVDMVKQHFWHYNHHNWYKMWIVERRSDRSQIESNYCHSRPKA